MRQLDSDSGLFEKSYDIPSRASSQEPNNLEPAVLLAVKALVMDDKDLQRHHESKDLVFPELIRKMSQVLRGVIRARQKDYSTTLKHDLDLLNSLSNPIRLRLAIETRLAEK